MNIASFMTFIMKDGLGSEFPVGGQQNGKATDKSFQDMMECMGMWMMLAPGMTQQDIQDVGNAAPEEMALVQGIGTVPGIDFIQAGEQVPDEMADYSVFMEKMALIGRQNRVVTEEPEVQAEAGDIPGAQAAKDQEPAGMDFAGWQPPETGADDQAEDMMPKAPVLMQAAQPEGNEEAIPAQLMKGAGDSAQAQDQETAGNQAGDQKAEAPAGALTDSFVASEPKPRTAQAHEKMPVYHHQVEHEQAIGKDLSELVSREIRTGNKEFEIQLEPQNLGRITIKVSSHDNQTTIAMLCSEEKTLSLLAQNAKELGAIMENNLGAPAQILVEKQAPDYLNQENGQNENQQKEQQKEKQRERKESGGDDFIQRLRLGMLAVS